MNKCPCMDGWMLCKYHLPDIGEPVDAFRKGIQNPDRVVLAQRRHKYGTKDEWEWFETTGGTYTYWGIDCDKGSEIVAWKYRPSLPTCLEL